MSERPKPRYRTERDSLGEIQVPEDALYGAQTQRAVENFTISRLRFPPAFLHNLGMIKEVCAAVNRELGRLPPDVADAIEEAAAEMRAGRLDDHFPLDIFQTGSGTSTNMNANEAIARLAAQKLGRAVHPNDHVNASQSSNDVIPAAIHLSAYREVDARLLPALEHLRETIERKAAGLDHVVKTGRTHLMDALPVRMGQELGAWASQVAFAAAAVRATLPGLAELAIGGTAIGTGLNAPPGFGARAASRLAQLTGLPLAASPNPFAAIAGQGAAVNLSGALKTAAVAISKIANDLRWMNSGPQAGLAEITLPPLQPGSSIMPGKVNPVIPEAVAMACAQVIGHDAAIALAGQSGSFQLNTMLPLIAYNLLESIELLSNAARLLADKAIRGFTVNEARLKALAERNPILVTALAPRIGYDLAAQIANRALAEDRGIREVAREMTGLSAEELDRLLDVRRLTEGGVLE
ncbi:MAG: class II fumarate hydratase [Bryobacteraceae bacterium]|nr:class II fumarate hydratase [Bryobacteraceae bacterium]